MRGPIQHQIGDFSAVQAILEVCPRRNKALTRSTSSVKEKGLVR